MTLKPWMAWSGHDDWLVCLMCPTDKSDKEGNVCYRAINTARKTRRQIAKWYRVHWACGFSRPVE